jgi:hypothetical protein
VLLLLFGMRNKCLKLEQERSNTLTFLVEQWNIDLEYEFHKNCQEEIVDLRAPFDSGTL